MLEKLKGYLGNDKLKGQKTEVQWTPETIAEYEKCMDDPIYWAEKYFKIITIDYGEQNIKLYDFQKEIIRAAFNNPNTIVLTGRQQGKCSRMNSLVEIRNSSTGQLYKIEIGIFHEWLKFRETYNYSLDSLNLIS